MISSGASVTSVTSTLEAIVEMKECLVPVRTACSLNPPNANIPVTANLLGTLGYDLNLFSSAIKLNTQYMHTIFFDIRLKNSTSLERVIELAAANDKIALTHKQSANQVFSFGRDQGHYGRILNVTVLAVPTLTVRKDKEIVGYCFTPQDGNSLLSSVAAATWFLYPDDYEDRIQCLQPLFSEEV